MNDAIAITSGTVVLPDMMLANATVVVQNGTICWVGPDDGASVPPDAAILPAAGKLVLPGLIDTHIHGSNGDDVMLDGEDGLRRISRDLLRYGVTAWLPSTLAAPHADLIRAIGWCRDVVRNPGDGAIPLGIHVEGPYINPAKKGAQPPDGIRPPDLDECRALLDEADGTATMMTLAPELPGADRLIELLLSRGVIPSLGHSDADYETAMAAIRAGATHATHLFNAMPTLHHRKPGLVAACLNNPDVYVEVIADGVHLHPAMVRMVAKLKGPNRAVLITDAMSAVGRPDGTYTLGPNVVYVKGDRCTLADGTIASSMLTMNRAVRNAAEYAGIPLPEAARMASLLPAKLCGVGDRKGSLERGKDADIAVLNQDFTAFATIVGGKVLYRA
jgi:N-acetylglucosamine-6-phosphate deacetylase